MKALESSLRKKKKSLQRGRGIKNEMRGEQVAKLIQCHAKLCSRQLRCSLSVPLSEPRSVVGCLTFPNHSISLVVAATETYPKLYRRKMRCEQKENDSVCVCMRVCVYVCVCVKVYINFTDVLFSQLTLNIFKFLSTSFICFYLFMLFVVFIQYTSLYWLKGMCVDYD